MSGRKGERSPNGAHPHGFSSLRRAGKPQYPSLSLTVPSPISRALIEAGLEHALFKCELTEEGLLFRRVAREPNPSVATLPAWAKDEERVT